MVRTMNEAILEYINDKIGYSRCVSHRRQNLQ